MKWSEHVHILKTLNVPYKAQLIRIIYHIAREHKDKTVEDLCDAVFGKKRT